MLKPNVFEYARTLLPHGGRRGKVFAVRVAPDRWGFIRFRGGAGFGFLPVYSAGCGMPRLDWAADPEVWFASELSGPETYQADDYVLVGRRLPVSAWMPDMFQRPQFPWQPWIVFHEDKLVRVNGPGGVAGMQESRCLHPGQITDFLRQKYAAGELTEVEVGPPEPCPPDPADQPWEPPTIVFAKIVQPIHPTDRERLYEEPLAKFLAERDLGEITGGGTMQDGDGSVLFAGIDIEVRDPRRAVPRIARKLAELGAPEGSELAYAVDDQQVVHPIRKPARRQGRGTQGS
jgi:hypothetical protein